MVTLSRRPPRDWDARATAPCQTAGLENSMLYHLGGSPTNRELTAKQGPGGSLERFYNFEVVLAPGALRFQERILSPIWDRVHPLYFKLTTLWHARRWTSQTVVTR